MSIYLSIYLSIYPSIHPSIHRSIYLSIYLSLCLSIYLPLKTRLLALLKVINRLSGFRSACMTCTSAWIQGTICLSVSPTLSSLPWQFAKPGDQGRFAFHRKAGPKIRCVPCVYATLFLWDSYLLSAFIQFPPTSHTAARLGVEDLHPSRTFQRMFKCQSTNCMLAVRGYLKNP